MGQFSVNINDTFIIYGASYLGENILEQMIRHNAKVLYFIDKRADAIKEINLIPVISPQNIKIVKEAVVIIAVTNYKEHIYIAQYLYKLGFTKILFNYPEKEISMQNMLSDIYNGNTVLLESTEFLNSYRNNTLYYKKLNNEYITTIVPVELLFVMYQGKQISILQYEPLLSYFNFLEGQDKDEYFSNFIKKNEKNYDWLRWMDEKRILYKELSDQFTFKCLSEDNFPVISWDGNGKFIVEKNIETCIFYIAKKILKIECITIINDYNAWLNEKEIEPSINMLQDNSLSYVYTPILHPWFYEFPSKRENCGDTRIMSICRYLANKNIDINNKRILDAGANICYFSQQFIRMGAHVTAVEYDSLNYNLGKQLNKLLYCDDIDFINGNIQDLGVKSVDITIMLSVLNWHIKSDIGKLIINKINDITKELFIWESGDEIEYEKNWILNNSTFNKYEKITNTFGTGKLREMGIFYREV